MFGVACTGTPQTRSASSREAGASGSAAFTDDTRGFEYEPGRLGFDHSLQLRHSQNDAPHELHDGETVMSGDRLRAAVRTSEDAHVYLAFCSHHELAVIPSQSGTLARAGEPTAVPPGHGDVVLDNEPGPEVLYVIVSRNEIAMADPRLASALTATRPGDAPTDCGASMDAKLAKPTKESKPHAASGKETTTLRGTLVRKQPRPPVRSVENPPSPISTSPPAYREGGSVGAPLIASSGPAYTLPDPDFERYPGNIVWYGADGTAGPTAQEGVVAADPEGIAVVRYHFTHVARTSQP